MHTFEHQEIILVAFGKGDQFDDGGVVDLTHDLDL